MTVQDEGFDTALGASYRLEQRLGQGAMGDVWSAVDRRTNETVAAKLLRSEHVADQDLVSRFLRERSILTGLRHTNLVAVRDLVVEGERLAIVMDYVDGGSLRDVLVHTGPLPPTQAVDLTAAVLDGLAAAHDKGVLHRDIKPDNVLLARDWHEVRPGDVKLTDFGIARIVAEGVRTTTGLLGTPEYMCPELIATGGADLPADVYGIGILLYELLAGRTPFAGPGTDYTVAHRHVTSEPPGLPVPDDLWAALAVMLDKDPARRPDARSAASRLRALRPALVDLPPLERQSSPESFGSAQGPATVVRGLQPAPAPAPIEDDDTDGVRTLDEIELGAPQGATIVRPLERPTPAREERPRTTSTTTKQSRPVWRDPRAIGLTVAALVLLGGGMAFAMTTGGGDDEDGGGTASGPISANLPGQALPSGLTVDRAATYDPEAEEVALTLTYSAQTAPLTGPFVEVLPGPESGCASPLWDSSEHGRNVSTTGFDEPCAWSIEPEALPAQGSTDVTATIPITFEGDDPNAALNEWLASTQAATDALTTDATVASTAYPAQRMTGVAVSAPLSTPSNKLLEIRVLPVWPDDGEGDTSNPLFNSTALGDASLLLQAVAGGTEGLRLTAESCPNGLLIQDGGLTVSSLSTVPDCRLTANVGNFPPAASNPIAIVTRGG